MMIRRPRSNLPPELTPYCHVCAGHRDKQDWDMIKHLYPLAEPHRTHRKTPHGSVARRTMREPYQDGYKRYTIFGIDQLQDSPQKRRNTYSSTSVSPQTPPYSPQHVLPEAFTPEKSSYNRARRKPFFKREMYSSDVDEEDRDDPKNDPYQPQSSRGRKDGRKKRKITVKKECTSVSEENKDTKPTLKKKPRELRGILQDQYNWGYKITGDTEPRRRSQVSQNSWADSIVKKEEEFKVKEEPVPAFRPIPLDSTSSTPYVPGRLPIRLDSASQDLLDCTSRQCTTFVTKVPGSRPNSINCGASSSRQLTEFETHLPPVRNDRYGMLSESEEEEDVQRTKESFGEKIRKVKKEPIDYASQPKSDGTNPPRIISGVVTTEGPSTRPSDVEVEIVYESGRNAWSLTNIKTEVTVKREIIERNYEIEQVQGVSNPMLASHSIESTEGRPPNENNNQEMCTYRGADDSFYMSEFVYKEKCIYYWMAQLHWTVCGILQ